MTKLEKEIGELLKRPRPVTNVTHGPLFHAFNDARKSKVKGTWVSVPYELTKVLTVSGWTITISKKYYWVGDDIYRLPFYKQKRITLKLNTVVLPWSKFLKLLWTEITK